VIPPLGASWAEARAAGRPRLWFRGYRGDGPDRLLAGRVGDLLTRESLTLIFHGKTNGTYRKDGPE
jgi:hypothetical protein